METYNEYYEGYILNDGLYSWNLTNRDKRILNEAIFLVDNNMSIRRLSKEFLVSKSQIHRDLTVELRKISFELYQVVQKIFKKNKEKYFR